jgi:hypothetical protein
LYRARALPTQIGEEHRNTDTIPNREKGTSLLGELSTIESYDLPRNLECTNLYNLKEREVAKTSSVQLEQL